MSAKFVQNGDIIDYTPVAATPADAVKRVRSSKTSNRKRRPSRADFNESRDFREPNNFRRTDAGRREVIEGLLVSE